MNLATRDAYVLDLLATFAAQGLSARQCVQRTIAVAGIDRILLPGQALSDLDSDVTGLQTAAAPLADPATRTAATTDYTIAAKAGLFSHHPTATQTKAISSADHYKQRVINSGR